MQDIGQLLKEIMVEKQCSSVYALLLLKEDKDVSVLQPKSTRQTNGRLCDTGNIESNQSRLG